MEFIDEVLEAGLRDLAEPNLTREDCERFARTLAPSFSLDDFGTIDEFFAMANNLPPSAGCLASFCWTILKTDASLERIRACITAQMEAGGLPTDLNTLADIVKAEE